MPPGCYRHLLISERDMNLRIGVKELLRHLDDGGLWGSQLQMLQEGGSDPLIHQDSTVLRVVAELNNVEMSVVRFQQMSLRATSHFANQLRCVNRH